MYKHYYMKQYNCVFCAFPLLSVCLTSFAPILTTNENWILFLAFLKIMWTIFGWKWHFPSRNTTYDIEHDKKECQERRNWSRRIKVSQEDGQNWSCGSISVFVCIFWTNDLICIIVKTWENISSLFYHHHHHHHRRHCHHHHHGCVCRFSPGCSKRRITSSLLTASARNNLRRWVSW